METPLSRIATFTTQAPLMSTAESRLPEGGSGEWYRGAGGLRLRVGVWQGLHPVRGTVFISPGRSEPIEKYYELIESLIGRHFAVVAHDWRGQGLSARLLPDRLKCHARAIDEFTDDFTALCDAFEGRVPKPWFMIGHSMGASLNLLNLLKGEVRFAGAVFTSPMLRVRTPGTPLFSVRMTTDWKVKQGQGSDYVPELFDDPFENTFEKDALTHDQTRYENWQEHLFACPHLAVGSPTWGWADFAIKLGDTILADKGKMSKKVKLPITFLSAPQDSLVNPKPLKSYAKKLGKAKVVDMVGAEHEIWIELDEIRDRALHELDVMLDSLAPQESEAMISGYLPQDADEAEETQAVADQG